MNRRRIECMQHGGSPHPAHPSSRRVIVLDIFPAPDALNAPHDLALGGFVFEAEQPHLDHHGFRGSKGTLKGLPTTVSLERDVALSFSQRDDLEPVDRPKGCQLLVRRDELL